MKKEKIKSQTGIQVCAFLLIFLWHTNFPKPGIDVGARGCEILILVSGFLTAYNHFDDVLTLKDSIRNHIKRYLKLLPLHLATIIATKIIIKNRYTFIATLLNVLLLQTWVNDAYISMSYNGGSWFLSILLFCYFVSPLYVKVLKKYNVGAVLSITFILRFLIEYLNDLYNLGLIIHTNTIARTLEFFMGMGVYKIYSSLDMHNTDKKVFSIMEITTFVVYVLLCRTLNFVWPRSLFILSFCPALLVFAFNKGILSDVLNLEIFQKFKYIQLQFYMWSISVIFFIDLTFKNIPWYVETPLAFIITLLIAVISKKIDNIWYKKVDDMF